MDPDAVKADVERALRACYPDRADEILRQLEPGPIPLLSVNDRIRVGGGEYEIVEIRKSAAVDEPLMLRIIAEAR